MQHFLQRIEVNGNSFNFYFNRINTIEGDRFHISTIGVDKRVCSFFMRQENGNWKISNPNNCPEWIKYLEPKLSLAIIESLGI